MSHDFNHDYEPLLDYLVWDDPPPGLRGISAMFGQLAKDLTTYLPRTPERTVALRKLLESRDAAARARVTQLKEQSALPSDLGQV